MLDRDWSLSGKNGRSGLVAMVYVVATRGKLLKGTSREQAFLQKRPVAIKHFCERDQSRSQITTSNYILGRERNRGREGEMEGERGREKEGDGEGIRRQNMCVN